jgi:DNA (cytosine-5)-methyltransferase 1
MSAKAIDIFCGAGGLTFGLQKAGIPVVLGVDLDPACEYPYTSNTGAKFLSEDVAKVSKDTLLKKYGNSKYKILVGCAPCQPFSTYTQGLKIRDSRWSLLRAFSELAIQLAPDVISMENVTQLARHRVYKDFLKDLKKAGYHVSESKVRCVQYGVPQTRKRLVVLASKHGPIDLIKPTHSADDKRLTVRHAIRNLEHVRAGWQSKKDKLHCAAGLAAKNFKRLCASNPGGTWKDWKLQLRADCHRKKSGAHYGGVYGRMEWDRPAPTITTQCYGFGSGRFGHPEQNRALTLREAAILQTFPRSYKFIPPREEASFRGVGRLIGNAVPVKLGRAIGKTILAHLSEVQARG